MQVRIVLQFRSTAPRGVCAPATARRDASGSGGPQPARSSRAGSAPPPGGVRAGARPAREHRRAASRLRQAHHEVQRHRFPGGAPAWSRGGTLRTQTLQGCVPPERVGRPVSQSAVSSPVPHQHRSRRSCRLHRRVAIRSRSREDQVGNAVPECLAHCLADDVFRCDQLDLDRLTLAFALERHVDLAVGFGERCSAEVHRVLLDGGVTEHGNRAALGGFAAPPAAATMTDLPTARQCSFNVLDRDDGAIEQTAWEHSQHTAAATSPVSPIRRIGTADLPSSTAASCPIPVSHISVRMRPGRTAQTPPTTRSRAAPPP